MRGDEIMGFFVGSVKNIFSNTRLFFIPKKKRWDNLSNLQSKFFSSNARLSQDYFYSKNKLFLLGIIDQISEINYCSYTISIDDVGLDS